MSPPSPTHTHLAHPVRLCLPRPIPPSSPLSRGVSLPPLPRAASLSLSISVSAPPPPHRRCARARTRAAGCARRCLSQTGPSRSVVEVPELLGDLPQHPRLRRGAELQPPLLGAPQRPEAVVELGAAGEEGAVVRPLR